MIQGAWGIIGECSIDGREIDTEVALKVSRPLWQKVHETAAHIRGWIEKVLDPVKAQGLLQKENPAPRKGYLVAVLPKRQRLTRGHPAALPSDDLPALRM